MDCYRGDIVSHAIKFKDKWAVEEFVQEKFNAKIDHIIGELEIEGFDPSEYVGVKKVWVDNIIKMANEEHLMDIGPYGARLHVWNDMFQEYIEEPMSFDGNGRAETKHSRILFDLADVIKEDLKDFEKMNEGLEPTDRHYIGKVWFTGVLIKGDNARVMYGVIDGGRGASGKMRTIHKGYNESVWTMRKIYQDHMETKVWW